MVVQAGLVRNIAHIYAVEQASLTKFVIFLSGFLAHVEVIFIFTINFKQGGGGWGGGGAKHHTNMSMQYAAMFKGCKDDNF